MNKTIKELENDLENAYGGMNYDDVAIASSNLEEARLRETYNSKLRKIRISFQGNENNPDLTFVDVHEGHDLSVSRSIKVGEWQGTDLLLTIFEAEPSKSEYIQQLEEDSKLLNALLAGGVQDWQWYDACLEDMDDE